MTNTELPDPHDFVLVLSVGKTIAPLIKSIQHYQPLYAIFIASRETYANIAMILEQVSGIKKHATITVSDFENLLECVRDMRDELPKKLHAMSLPSDILIIADFTGGSKVMVAALALVMMEYNSRFTYVGGDIRDPGGRVKSGQEKIMQMDNPWEVLGVPEARRLAQAFNSGHFESAKREADFIKSKNSEYGSFYGALGDAIVAFMNWDSFNHETAWQLLKQAVGRLKYYDNHRHKNFRSFYERLQQAFSLLTQVKDEASVLLEEFKPLEPGFGEAYLRDLVGNARRCAKRGRYDDAVARLYSAIEKTAKIALAQKGINNSDVSREALSLAGEDLAAKYTDKTEEKIGIPLGDSFQLICRLEPDHQVSCAYTRHQDNLEKALEFRNQSLLAHGYRPVSADDYDKLFKIALQFLGISEAELPDFPELEPNSILF